MTYFIGVDGGGSNLRVVITDGELNVISQAYRLTANPSIVGRTKSALMIQSTIREALSHTDLHPSDITGVGIGIAGASVDYAEGWLIDTIASAIPHTCIVPSSDNEIALVGAHGQRRGVLILAGTGSVAYGVNEYGKQVQVGGWGYLIGDEGSAYWMGKRALQLITQSVDGRTGQTELTNSVLRVLNLKTARDLILWLYDPSVPRMRDVALLAPMVIELADAGDHLSRRIVNEAAEELFLMTQAVIQRLGVDQPNIAFAGGLLEKPNLLSVTLQHNLGIAEFPRPVYSPVVGAALLARMKTQEEGYANGAAKS